MARRIAGFVLELPVLVLIAFVLALLLKTFLVQAFFIPSESMLPTLHVGDRVLVNKVVYELRPPRRGEIVVFAAEDAVPQAAPSESPVVRLLQSVAAGLGLTAPGEKDFIKRVIGLPGETVEMRDGIVYINGEPLTEAPTVDGGYLSERDLRDFAPVEIPEGHYFVMGDNRPNSSDSRTLLGTVPRDEIVGRAFVVVWPPSRFEILSPPEYQVSSAAAARAATLPSAA